ncbi:MAG: hypothetical protein RL637_1247 [Pseudomonadota bacterium]|jgi:DNA polymerase-3 subunit gamma/tau
MAYQVLARKWRPQNFSQLVGQEHVAQSLINALQHQRLHHAYLFTGTRGVGKTTIARILAKAINCENLQQYNPCGTCTVCRDFDHGRFMDLIEVDAASRTKVEDTRDLLDNVQYAPSHGRYKVYLIDEVHMLSSSSFNALLKTLEEPPEHVKFLLATTDPHKIPVTVLSRCLQFNLKRLLPQQISEQMAFILRQEQIEFDLEALPLLARAADGSLRDGLSLLDQAIAFGQGRVNRVDVEAMLGTVAQQPVDDLLRALAEHDGIKILAIIAQISELTPDFHEVLQQLLRVLHRVALLQSISKFVDQEFDPILLNELAASLSVEEVQLYYQIGIIGQKELDLAPDPRTGFEMILLRMLTFRPITTTVSTKKTTDVVRSSPVIKNSSVSHSELPISSTKIATVATENLNWEQIIRALNLSGPTLDLAHHCALVAVHEQECILSLSAKYSLVTPKIKENLQTALQNYYQRSLKLILNAQTHADTPAIQQQQRDQRQQAAENAIHNDPTIQELKRQFEADIVSIEPL